MNSAKKKKKNKFLPLIILVCVLAVLLIVYAALSSANRKAEEEEAARLAEENEDVMIAEYEAETMTHLSYQKSGGDELSFTCTNSSWSWDGDSHFPLNQNLLSTMATAIAKIAVECSVDEGAEADYGLDNPAYTIKVEYDGGTAHTYKIGDYNSFNSCYYFSADGEMYMIKSGLTSYFSYTLDSLMNYDTLPTADWSDMTYVESVDVTKNGTKVSVTGDEEKEAALELVKKLTLRTCADYYAKEYERDYYGLDGANAVTVNYKKAKTTTDESGNESTVYLSTSYTVTIGSKTEEGYYVSPDKSDIVYLESTEAVEAILALAE